MKKRTKKLTDKQLSIYQHILKFIQEHGYQPSMASIQKAFKYKSANSVFGHIKALEKKGYIKRYHGRIEFTLLPNGSPFKGFILA